jgi:hypothetical protein
MPPKEDAMTGILWLASYPKSGNTWLRAFLANYLADAPAPVDINSLPDFAFGDMRIEPYARLAGKAMDRLDAPRIAALRPAVHRYFAATRPGLVFVKTHTMLTTVDGVPTITPDATAGAICVVRNPCDVAVSFAHHYGLTIDEGVRAVCFSGLRIEPKAGHVPQFVSDWSSHVTSWLRPPGLVRLTLRYEDMLSSPQGTFGRVLEFLKLPKDRERLKRAIRHSSFRVLAEQERRQGFIERSRNADRFFRRGGAGGYRSDLTDEHVAALIDQHRATLAELGYLDGSGKLAV